MPASRRQGDDALRRVACGNRNLPPPPSLHLLLYLFCSIVGLAERKCLKSISWALIAPIPCGIVCQQQQQQRLCSTCCQTPTLFLFPCPCPCPCPFSCTFTFTGLISARKFLRPSHCLIVVVVVVVSSYLSHNLQNMPNRTPSCPPCVSCFPNKCKKLSQVLDQVESSSPQRGPL